MKPPFARAGSSAPKTAVIASVAFLVIFAAALCAKPINNKFASEIFSFMGAYKLLLKEELGLELRYASFSPSLLFAASIRDMELLDCQSGARIAGIKKAVLSYNVRKFLGEDAASAFKKLSLLGVEFDAAALAASDSRQKIFDFFTRISADAQNTQNKTLRIVLPFDVSAKSIKVTLGSLVPGNSSLAVQSVQLTRGKSGYIKASLKGNAELIPNAEFLSRIPAQFRSEAERCAFDFLFSGLISPTLINSSASLSFPSVRLKKAEFKRLDFLAEYLGDIIRVTQLSGSHFTASNTRASGGTPANALNLVCDISLPVETVRLRMRADSFNPLEAVRVQTPATALFAGTRVSGDYSVTWTRSKRSMDYEARGKITLPFNQTLGRLTADFSIYGDTKRVHARRMSLLSEKLEASFEGSFAFKNLQPSGQAEIARFELPNGNQMSAEAYFDPLDEGFLCFVPQLFFGESAFTALQLTVIPNAGTFDFAFELSDYSHYEFDEPGVLRMEGSFFAQNPAFVQSYVSVENFFRDSIMEAAAFFLSEQTASRLEAAKGFAKPYILTTEMFVSTDFAQLTYNVPYSIIANTRRDRNFMLFAVDGNNSSLRVTRLDLAMSGQSIQAVAALDATSDYNDFFFTADVVANSIPYSFTGSIMPGVMTHITGNYGFTATVYDNGESGFTGALTLGDFPLAFSKYIFSLSSSIDFSWSQYDGLRATVAAFEAEEINNAIPVNPHVLLSGALNDHNFRIETIAYSDSVSQISGRGSVVWTSSDSMLETLVFTLSAENPLGAERVSAQLNVSTLGESDFPPRSFMENYYFSAMASVNGLLSAHFVQNQSRNDSISAELAALGTLADPFVTLTVEQSSMTLVSGRLTANGNAALEGGNVGIERVNAKWGAHELRGGNASFSLADFTGAAKGEYFFNFGDRSITAPLEASFISDGPFVSAETGKKSFPRSFVLMLSSNGCISPAFRGPKSFSLRAVRRPGRFDVHSVGTDSISGWLLDTGELEFKLGGALPVRMRASGSIDKGHAGGLLPSMNGALDIDIEDININVGSFAAFLDFSVFAAHRGVIEGNLHAGGVLSAPDFDGALTLTNIEISSPQFAPAHFTSPYVFASVAESTLEIYDAMLQSGNAGRVALDLILALDRWNFEMLTLRFITPDNMTVPIDARFDRIYARCDVSSNIEIEVQREMVALTGSLRAQNGMFEVSMSDFEGVNLLAYSTPQHPQAPPPAADVNANLRIFVGARMQVRLNTTQNESAIGFRGLVSQGTEIRLLVDSLNEYFEIQGDVALRGGEIMYFNRNFYMREGRIVFNETMGEFDPRITVRAETRDRDSEGEQVRIIMSADNQLLSQFNPLFSSSPAKSEAEIMHILGQIVTGDSESLDDLAFAMLDYGVQMAVLRKIETGLRELLNFDIFSMRTMIVQNVLRSQVDTQRGDGPIAAGSIFDNSTVYAGKYFGSSIYADALLHLSYDENEVLSGRSETGIVFQPEFGLEMMSPYVTIRWSIAPELGKTDFLWVDATSITLSWKFNF